MGMWYGPGYDKQGLEALQETKGLLVSTFEEERRMDTGFVLNGGSLRPRQLTVSAASRKGKKGKTAKGGKQVRPGSGTGFGPPKEEKLEHVDTEIVAESDSVGAQRSAEDEVMAKFGVYQSSGAKVLQEKVERKRRADEEREKSRVSNYSKLVSKIGIDGVGKLDKALATACTVCLAVVFVTGILIGVEAFFKATGQDVPQNLDQFLVQGVNYVFTPSLLIFFACSINLGLLKSAQIDEANDYIRSQQDQNKK
ncbi:hypothetical protein NDN08_007933 [Rhodosorus marinus]|uniref:Uncharacterized protein n=1 Tax=Rhodosorus marinus TaxID=101924 RepID=A0AAV8UZA6_9RHOD|nr:hypothetical protein NDN08_007933 [Rhodosorus marinus]